LTQFDKDKFADRLIKQTVCYSAFDAAHNSASMAAQIKWKKQKLANNTVLPPGQLIITVDNGTKERPIKLILFQA
jgi:hypothetical protein